MAPLTTKHSSKAGAMSPPLKPRPPVGLHQPHLQLSSLHSWDLRGSPWLPRSASPAAARQTAGWAGPTHLQLPRGGLSLAAWPEQDSDLSSAGGARQASHFQLTCSSPGYTECTCFNTRCRCTAAPSIASRVAPTNHPTPASSSVAGQKGNRCTASFVAWNGDQRVHSLPSSSSPLIY